MQYKLIVDKQSRLNPSTNMKTYILDIEELRTNGDISDELIISPNESYVMRRLSLSKYHVLSVLDESIKEVIENPKIELFEGNNYIYLIDMTGNRFYAEYLIKNEFNDTFITKKEANAKIDVASQQVIISVNEKLTSYSTTEEINALIQLLTNQIKLELEKKVDGETITGAYLLLQINKDTSGAKLKADKIDLIGYITATNLKTAGQTIINGSNITTGTIDASKVNVTNLNANNITSGTINASKVSVTNLNANNIISGTITGRAISGGTITGTQITNGNNFSVDKNGSMTCNSGKFINGEIELLSNRGSAKFRAKSNDGSECQIAGGAMLITEKEGSYIPAQINMGLNEDGSNSPGISLISRDFAHDTQILSSGITTPKLTQTSLKSKKKNIKKLKSNALELVKNADICEYNFKGEKKGTKKHIGLVIGEGYNCPTEVISEDGQGVDQYSLTSLLWKAVQELTAKVEQLEVALNGKN